MASRAEKEARNSEEEELFVARSLGLVIETRPILVSTDKEKLLLTSKEILERVAEQSFILCWSDEKKPQRITRQMIKEAVEEIFEKLEKEKNGD